MIDVEFFDVSHDDLGKTLKFDSVVIGLSFNS